MATDGKKLLVMSHIPASFKYRHREQMHRLENGKVMRVKLNDRQTVREEEFDHHQNATVKPKTVRQRITMDQYRELCRRYR